MILGIGIDLVSVPRVQLLRERRGMRGLERLLTPRELGHCLAQAAAGPSLAARVAAKEAYYKAIGTGVGRHGGWRDVEVARRENGRPLLILHGAAARHARERGVQRVHLAITHAGDMAAATVTLEGVEPSESPPSPEPGP
jgi:holo-[acyl-carrier protein] synthase